MFASTPKIGDKALKASGYNKNVSIVVPLRWHLYKADWAERRFDRINPSFYRGKEEHEHEVPIYEDDPFYGEGEIQGMADSEYPYQYRVWNKFTGKFDVYE
jgi:hypothetical protein